MALGNLAVELKLIANQYFAGMKDAQREATALSNSFRPLTKTLADVGSAMKSVGVGLTAAVTVPLAAVGAFAVKTGIDFETAFAGIRKNVQATEPQFASLRNELRQMAKEIPVSAVELANVGEAAGQLGIKTENIAKFTKVMAMMGSTTNMSATTAADAMARFDNITGRTQTNFDRMGSTLVALGADLAATESEIIAMAQNMGAAGHQIGLTQAEILGLAGALSSVGLEAERGGTAFYRVMIKMQDAVKSGGKDLQMFSAVAGVDFKKAFEEDAANAINAFIAGLAKAHLSGVNLTPILESLELGEIRVSDALRRTGNAYELVAGATDLARDAFAKNTALQHEFNERLKTTEAKLKILKQALQDVGIELFDALRPIIHKTIIPLLGEMADGVAAAAKAFGQLPQPVQTGVIAVAGLAAAIGPVLFGLGQMIFSISQIIPVVVKLTGLISSLGAAISGLSGLTVAYAASAALLVSGTVALGAAIGYVIGRFINWAIASAGLNEELDQVVRMIAHQIPILGRWATGQSEVDKATAGLTEAQIKATAALKARGIEEVKLQTITVDGRQRIETYDEALARLRRTHIPLSAATKETGKATNDLGIDTSGLTKEQKALIEQLTKGVDAKAKAKTAAEQAAEAYRRFRESVASIKDVLRDTTPPTKELVTAIHELHESGQMNSTAILNLAKDYDTLKNSKDPVIQQYLRMLPLMQLQAKAAELEAGQIQAVAEATKDWAQQSENLDFSFLPKPDITMPDFEPLEPGDLLQAEAVTRVEELKDQMKALKATIPAVERQAKLLRAENKSDAEIMALLGGEMENAARIAKQFNVPLGELTRTIIYQQDRVNNLRHAWSETFASISDSLVDMVVSFEFSFKKLVDIAKDAARSLLRSFLDGFFKPFKDSLADLGGSLADALSGALFGGGKGGGPVNSVLGAGGQTGILSKALSKIPGLGFLGAGAGTAALVGTAAGIPLAGSAAATSALASSLAIPETLAAITPLAGPGSAAAAGGAAGGGGFMGGAGALLTNPITGIAASAVIAASVIKAGHWHEVAEDWTENVQELFDKRMVSLNESVNTGMMSWAEGESEKLTATQDYLRQLFELSQQGNSGQQVARQALETFQKNYGDPSQYGVNMELPTGFKALSFDFNRTPGSFEISPVVPTTQTQGNTTENSGGNTYNITINAPSGDGQDIAQQIWNIMHNNWAGTAEETARRVFALEPAVVSR